MILHNILLVLLACFLKEVICDCGCSSTNREERAKKYERSETGIENDHDSDSALLHAEDYDKMSLIPGQVYTIGTNDQIFESVKEGPEREVEIEKFYLDKYEVSNSDFDEFVKQTDYKTEAEIFGDSFVFKILLSEEDREKYDDFRVLQAPWWYKVKDANWRQPEGPNTNIAERMNHPVVHVTWNDAVRYCQWKKKRLPTEDEWEAACRGGKKRKLFPWGNKETPNDKHWMNIWQGKFPDENTAEDGEVSTCAVDKYRQNDFELYNMVGNVWEWTSNLWKEDDVENENPDRVKRGGSYLCHKSYCYRYRCAARSQNTQDSSAGNLSFRCAKNFY